MVENLQDFVTDGCSFPSVIYPIYFYFDNVIELDNCFILHVVLCLVLNFSPCAPASASFMSDHRLRNQVLHHRPDPLNQPTRTPVLLSDSKGLYLKDEESKIPETFIQFWCRSGATAENRLDYLRQN